MSDAVGAAKDILQLVRMSPVIAAETYIAQGLIDYAAKQQKRAEAGIRKALDEIERGTPVDARFTLRALLADPDIQGVQP